MFKVYIYLVMFLLISFQSFSQTNVSGTISSNTTWTLTGSPYIVVGDVTVNSGVILTIEPGVQVRFNTSTDLIINGALVANGSSVDSIIFTANSVTPTTGAWGGIKFNQSVLSTTSILNYCAIEYGGTTSGGQPNCLYLDPRANPKMTNLTLYKNRFNGIALVSGTYFQNILLDITDKPYLTLPGNQNIAIDAGYKITLKPGVMLKLSPDTDLPINGALVADGKLDSLIVFTSIKDDSIGGDTNNDGPSIGLTGDWGGIAFYQSAISTQSILNYCKIKYGGSTSSGSQPNCIYLDPRANPKMTNLTMYKNRYNGIGLISGTYSQNILLDIVDKPYFTFSGNQNIGINAGYKITLKPGVMLKLSPDTDLPINGALVADGKLDSLIVFTSIEDDSIGGDTNNDGPSIGLTGDWGGIAFYQSAISTQSILNYCKIKYGGSTSSASQPNCIYLDPRANPKMTNLTMYKNRYNGIGLISGNYSQNILLDIVDKPYFTFSGQNIGINTGYKITLKPGVMLKLSPDSDLPINGALVADGKLDSLIVFTSIKDDSIGGDTNNDGPSVGLTGDWGGFAFNQSAISTQSILNYCKIKYGGSATVSGVIVLDAGANPEISNLIMYKNRYNGIFLNVGATPTNITLDIPDIPYVLTSSPTIGSSRTLNIKPGTIIKSSTGIILYIDGKLKAQGTTFEPVIFTSLKDDSRGGDTNNDGISIGSGNDWGGIYFRNTSIDTACVLKYVEIYFGGGVGANGNALVGIADASPKVELCKFGNSGNSGIRCSGVSLPDIGGGSQNSIGFNQFQGFVGSGHYAFYNDGTANISAQSNCWDTTDSLQINQIIYDKRDNSTKGLVTYQPYRENCDTILFTTFQLSVSINNGWNMVSVPGINPDGMGVSNWWSGHTGIVYKFIPGSGYTGITTTTPGEGYWMKQVGNNLYNTGDEWPAGGIQIVPHDPLSVLGGWDMIGGYENTVDIASLTTTPPNQIVFPIYKFVPGTGYLSATTIEPGYGYWVKVLTDCEINIPDEASKGFAKETEYFKDDLSANKAGWGRITLTDASGSSYTLYAVKDHSPKGGAGSPNLIAGIDLNQYELPPLPPEGVFDIRFGSNRVAEDINGGFQSIEIRGAIYPIKVKAENIDIAIQDITGKQINSNLKAGEDITISNPNIKKLMVMGQALPIKFALEQNYPNPFNPVTTIKFSIPKEVAVNLSVYNILGEQVKVLKNDVMKPGYYEAELNATTLASGVYFYRIKAGDFIQTKKMLLLK